MDVTFHMHTPPASTSHGAPKPGPVLYIRLDGGRQLHVHEVVDRLATEDDKRRYHREWASFRAQGTVTVAPAAVPKKK